MPRMSITNNQSEQPESTVNNRHDADSKIQVHIAQTRDQIAAAWSLVYQAYRSAAIIDSNSMGIHTIPHALSPATTVIVGTNAQNQVVSTLTIMHDCSQGLSLDSIYGNQLDKLRQQNRHLMEVGLFAESKPKVDQANNTTTKPGAHTVTKPSVNSTVLSNTIYNMMRYVFYNSCYSLADIIIGVHPHHAGFYKRAFGFEVAGPIKQHPCVKHRPVILLRGDTKKTNKSKPTIAPDPTRLHAKSYSKRTLRPTPHAYQGQHYRHRV